MIYFDNAASSFPKPPSVNRAVAAWLAENGANPGRSGHEMSMSAGGVVFETRLAVAEAFGVDEPEKIVFVPNATFGLNMLIRGLLRPGEHAVTTELEHNSVLRPLRLAEKDGAEYDVAPVDLYDDGKTVENILKRIKKNTRLVICTQCSNVCGKVMPISMLSAALPNGVRLAVDGAQGAGVVPTDIKRQGIDYYCAPSHKGLLGPQGSGFVAVCAEPPQPLTVGGTGSESFDPEQPPYLPDRLESGTLPTPAIRGMLEGIGFIREIGIENIYRRKLQLVKYVSAELACIDGAVLYTDPSRAEFVGTTCFNLAHAPSDEVTRYLSDRGVCVRGGIHCAPLFHKKMGTEQNGSVRISFGWFNTVSEIDTFIKILKKFSKK